MITYSMIIHIGTTKIHRSLGIIQPNLETYIILMRGLHIIKLV
jgi:hypothetical protein